MKKFLIFDLDETLIDRSKTMDLFLRCQYERLTDIGSIAVDDFVSSVLKHQKNGYADKHVAYRYACSELLGEDSLAKFLFSDFKDKYGFEAVLFEGVKEVLERLSGKFSLGLVTNGRARCQNAKLDHVGIRHLFKSIKISEEFGIKKPDKSIFEACLNELGAKPSECICIGDNPENDLFPAKNIGMKVIWVRNNNFEDPAFSDTKIDSVAFIETTLKKLGV